MRKSLNFLAFALSLEVAIGSEVDYSKIAEASSARVESTFVRYSRIYG